MHTSQHHVLYIQQDIHSRHWKGTTSYHASLCTAHKVYAVNPTVLSVTLLSEIDTATSREDMSILIGYMPFGRKSKNAIAAPFMVNP